MAAARRRRSSRRTGVTVFAERTNAITRRTSPSKPGDERTDAILDYNFPNPLAVMSKQLIDNGVTVPHRRRQRGHHRQRRRSPGGGDEPRESRLRRPPTRPKVKKWVAATTKYGKPPIYSSAQAYDPVLRHRAVKVAGSVSPAKLLRRSRKSTTRASATYKSDVIGAVAAAMRELGEGEAQNEPRRRAFAPGALPFTVVTTTLAPTTLAPTTTPAPA
jgi:hypothetical protein